MGQTSKEIITLSFNHTDVWNRIAAFIDGKAYNTQETYLGILREWCRFLKVEPGTPEAALAILKADDLDSAKYRRWLHKQPGERPRHSGSFTTRMPSVQLAKNRNKTGLEATQSNATICKKLNILCRVYRVLMAFDFGIRYNPFDPDRVPRPPKYSGQKRPTERLDNRIVKRIVNMPDLTSPIGFRDRAILSALFGGGMRRSEVIGIRVGDVKTSLKGNTYLYLRATKTKKDREQAIPPWAAKNIKHFHEMRINQGAKGADYLFVTRTSGRGGKKLTINHPLSATAVYRLFKNYCALAGVDVVATPHSARATAITRLLEKGWSHREVQEFSGHSSVEMVEHYDKRRIGVDDNPGNDLDY